jgi:hypothetical protein
LLKCSCDSRIPEESQVAATAAAGAKTPITIAVSLLVKNVSRSRPSDVNGLRAGRGVNVTPPGDGGSGVFGRPTP